MRLLTFEQLAPEKGIAYCRDHLRRKVRDGSFPRPISLSDSRIAWVESEIDDWIKRKIARRDRRSAA